MSTAPAKAEKEPVKKKAVNGTGKPLPEKQLAPKQETALAEVPTGTWGDEELTNDDILVSKILCMQGLSKMVADDAIQARMGEFRDSVSAELLGDAKNPVELIPFKAFKTWVIFEEKDDEFVYVRTEAVTPENQHWPIEEELNGVRIRRDYVLNYYVLLPRDIEKNAAFPYVVSFRRTSLKTGKKVSTFVAKRRAFNQPAASLVLKLSATKTENDKGTFMVLDVAESRISTPAELAEAYKWYQTFEKVKVRVDESDVRTERHNVVGEAVATSDSQY